MTIDMHTHAGRPHQTGDVDRAVLATMGPAGVAAAVVSAIGDIQTEPPVHDGLIPFGAAVVQRMNKVNIILDVAHCPEEPVKGVADIGTRPYLRTHAN